MSMAMGALGIDLMLPAFDAMRADLGLAADSNAIAGTVTTYFFGLALGTFVYGPLSDRYGRRRSLYISYGIYGRGAVASAVAAKRIGNSASGGRAGWRRGSESASRCTRSTPTWCASRWTGSRRARGAEWNCPPAWAS